MNIKARRCAVQDGIYSQGPGAYYINDERTMIWLVLPRVGTPIRLPLTGDPPRWTFTGTADNPSLTPSINVPGIWHGHLTNGEFIEC